ncbi:flagellar protein FlgN [Georgenia sp. 311]|uniref:Flagellar protein FlgN n=1 Tax=Georgenia wutianyii TaxID=2585135 RepID=A0ABX5VK92_9MICO|nr:MULTISPECIES: flagellar export chaperone FlgN [Georgenia]QDB78156.1 flagellar protein FlgN [Georgenia wutianyii]TNC17601.1 flagellar protein FlgN [Georgenia sp. 311]
MLRSLSDLLWRERDLLDALRYRLEVEHLLLDAGRTDLLPGAVRDVDAVLAQVRTAELARTVEVAALVAELDLPDGASLLDIATAAPAPWEGILREHRAAFLTLTSEIASVARTNRDFLMSTHHATQETLMSLSESVDVYDARGLTTRGAADTHLVDKSL